MDRIGRYEILDELGRGAMGIVYRARDPSIGRLIAIKTIRLADYGDQVETERLRERLRREAHSAGILSHPGIVVVYDVGQEGELAYIAMEFIAGRSLEDVLNSQEAPEQKTILNVLRQTAAALDYAHKKGIVHRDIKPANILITEDGVAKITDFGVAKIASSHKLTHAGTVLGTPNYMSPEQIQGKEVDGRADQFALAVIAYEVLTGEKPFTAEQLTTLLYKIVGEPPAPPHNVNPTLGWPVSVVLNRALAKDPAERYKSCSEFVTALETALNTKKDWKAAPRAGADNLPTVGVGTTTRGRVKEKVEAAQVAAATQAKPPEPGPVERRPRKPSLLVPVLLTVLGAVAVGAGIFVAIERWGSQVPPAAGPESRETGDTGRPAPMVPGPQSLAAQPPAGAAQPPPAQPETPEAKPPLTQPQAPDAKPPAESPAKATAPVKPVTPPEITEKPRVETKPVAPPPPARQPAPRPPPANYTVLVTTSPPGAEVVFDDNPQVTCKSPCSLQLSAGRHTLSVALAGHRKELRIFELHGPREVFLNLRQQTGTVRVESTPLGAQIIVNGQARPETTPATLILPIGRYEVVVEKDGRKDHQSFELRDGALMRLSFVLQ